MLRIILHIRHIHSLCFLTNYYYWNFAYIMHKRWSIDARKPRVIPEDLATSLCTTYKNLYKSIPGAARLVLGTWIIYRSVSPTLRASREEREREKEKEKNVMSFTIGGLYFWFPRFGPSCRWVTITDANSRSR